MVLTANDKELVVKLGKTFKTETTSDLIVYVFTICYVFYHLYCKPPIYKILLSLMLSGRGLSDTTTNE